MSVHLWFCPMVQSLFEKNPTFILEGSQLRQRELLKLGQRLEAAALSTCE